MGINEAVQNLQNSIVKDINDSHLAPAIVGLVMQGLMMQVSEAARKAAEEEQKAGSTGQAESGGGDNGD